LIAVGDSAERFAEKVFDARAVQRRVAPQLGEHVFTSPLRKPRWRKAEKTLACASMSRGGIGLP
jgi:hypothetical protein